MIVSDSHEAIIGASGAGKSTTARVEVEALLDEGRHVCIIDPTGIWHGLRSNAAGDGPGFGIPIFGGDHGDVAVLPEQGEAVGKIIAGGVSAIVDVSGMDGRQQRRFVLGMMAALRKKPKANIHLVVDEADEFAPQTAPDDIGFELVEQMKWVAKRELFGIPVVGWMMRMAGDIPVDRSSARSGARAMKTAGRYLDQRCSVMFFPEGTRSRDGRVGAFNDGAFHLAARLGLPVLPIVVDGSHDCLPRRNWRFGKRNEIQVKVLEPLSPAGTGKHDAARLRDAARTAIIGQIALWRGVPAAEVDALARR